MRCRWTALTPGACLGGRCSGCAAGLILVPQVPPLPPRQRVVTAVLAGRLPAWSLATSLRSLFYPADILAAVRRLEAFELADKLFERVDRFLRRRAPARRVWRASFRRRGCGWSTSRLAFDLTRRARARRRHWRGGGAASRLSRRHSVVDAALANFPRILACATAGIDVRPPRGAGHAFEQPAAPVRAAKLNSSGAPAPLPTIACAGAAGGDAVPLTAAAPAARRDPAWLGRVV